MWKNLDFIKQTKSYFAFHLTADILGEADSLLSRTRAIARCLRRAFFRTPYGSRRRSRCLTSLTTAIRSPNSPPRDEWQDTGSSGSVRQFISRRIYLMFTGIISDVGLIESVEGGENLRHLRIACSYPAEEIAPGTSIACNGVCLTVTARGALNNGSWFEVDLGAETLARTTARQWQKGTRLNLERALRLGDELSGHMVTGHVDGTAEIIAVANFEGMRRIAFKAPHELARFIAEKGSVALDGTSLTVNSLEGDDFSVLLIPHTLKVTGWGSVKAGDKVNLEVDLLARYAARLAEAATP